MDAGEKKVVAASTGSPGALEELDRGMEVRFLEGEELVAAYAMTMLEKDGFGREFVEMLTTTGANSRRWMERSTGSSLSWVQCSLSWVQCSLCNISCHDQVGSVFDPSCSNSYLPIPCSSSECGSLASATHNPSGYTDSNVCVYEASYGDNSFSIGYLSKDTLSIASLSVPNFIYGCSQDNKGFFGQSAGPYNGSQNCRCKEGRTAYNNIVIVYGTGLQVVWRTIENR